MRMKVSCKIPCFLQAQFGTLSDYFDKIWEKTGVKPGTQPPGYPTLGGDFYTYADRLV
jgi:alpha-mannosidase II